MSSEPAELHPNTRQTVKALSDYRSESKAVVISSIALVVSCLAGLMAFGSWDDAKEAKSTTAVELRAAREEVRLLKQEIGVYRIRAAKLDAWLQAHGVPTEDIYQ